MLSHESGDTKDGAAYGKPQVDMVEDIGVPTDENYHGLTLSVVLIYLVRLCYQEIMSPLLICTIAPQASVAVWLSNGSPSLMRIVPNFRITFTLGSIASD